MAQANSNRSRRSIALADTYMAAALIICKQLLAKNVIKKNKFYPIICDRKLILPLAFNVKHGIELYLRALGIIDGPFLNNDHDLQKLFNLIKSQVRGTINEGIINRLYKDTWETISKYYFGRYIKIKKGCNFSDKNNQFELYPECKSENLRGKVYRIPKKFNWVTKELIREIQNDIRLMKEKFSEAALNLKSQKKLFA